MTLLLAALLGVIQGLTEFLPVSSTAHLLIAEDRLKFADPGGVFTVCIQLGSILAVMWLYRDKLFSVLTGLTRGGEARHFAMMVVVAFIPALVLGGLLSGFVKRVLYASPAVIAVAFIVGGIVMLAVERWRPTPTVMQADRTPLKTAFVIGCWQVLALVPGVSRSGSTIVGGLVSGLDRAAAAEFSFFLAMPTMAAAFTHDLWKARHDLGQGVGLEIVVGFVAAFVASLLVVKPFLRFVGRSGFAPFAWYRIIAGVVLLATLWIAR